MTKGPGPLASRPADLDVVRASYEFWDHPCEFGFNGPQRRPGFHKPPPKTVTKTCGAGWVTRACRTRASSRKLTRAKNYRPAGPKSQWTRPLTNVNIRRCRRHEHSKTTSITSGFFSSIYHQRAGKTSFFYMRGVDFTPFNACCTFKSAVRIPHRPHLLTHMQCNVSLCNGESVRLSGQPAGVVKTLTLAISRLI